MSTIVSLSFKTLNDTPVTKKIFKLNENCGWFDVNIAARAPNGESACWWYKHAIKHTSGGGIVLVGNKENIISKTPSTNSWWDADITHDTTFIEILLNGKAATTINWIIEATYIKTL
jgi:hypothetical protein